MATIIKVDGTSEQVDLVGPPGSEERLRQLQRAVGGYIELVGRTADRGYVLADEEGLLRHRAVNAAVSQQLGYPIVGDCIVLTPDEWQTE